MNETEENDGVRRTLRQAMPDDLPPAVAERMQNQLAAFRLRFDTESVNLRGRISHWIGGLTVRQRIAAFGGIGVAAMLGFLLLWGGVDDKLVSAMEQMAERIRKARSFQATMEETAISFPGEPAKVPAKAKITGTVYFLAPGSFRIDFKGTNAKRGAVLETDVKPQPQPQPDASAKGVFFSADEDITQIDFIGKPGIRIDHIAKTFARQPTQRELSRFPEMMEKLAQFAGQADRDLGTKEIHGKKARGFEIDGKKIDPHYLQGTLEVWIDDSKLPVLLRYRHANSEMAQTTSMQEFQWNIALDPKLFDATPPVGYHDNTFRLPEQETNLPLKEQVVRITEGLRLFANGPDIVHQLKAAGELFAGHYPETTEVGRRMSWIDKSGKVKETRFGLPEIAHILTTNPDAAYYGKTVGPKDKDKVLLRWKLDDGRYEVIFGNLRAETVTGERLRALEGK